ncbi:NLR family CARD domain-containing protein 3-like [Trichomycterus rosablanca]|uniref:NLR family CARD domain-containing protein 3-like n=1 Tax=Trichomycterus rosablanca TaxID=2290929 RepID=UPI002F350939
MTDERSHASTTREGVVRALRFTRHFFAGSYHSSFLSPHHTPHRMFRNAVSVRKSSTRPVYTLHSVALGRRWASHFGDVRSRMEEISETDGRTESTTFRSSFRAATRGIVNAPSLVSSTFSAPVTFNFNTSTGETGKGSGVCGEARRHHNVRNELKSCTKKRCAKVYEGTSEGGCSMALNDIYTELYIVEGHTGGISQEHEIWQIEAMSRVISEDTPVKFNKIFGVDSQNRRTVLTLGIAGVGKTVSVQKFALEWAEGKTNEDLDFVFLMPFRDLNPIMEERYSLFTLLCYFYHVLDLRVEDMDELDACNVMFVFDGLDESCLALNLASNKMICDATEVSTVYLLLVNIIAGNLLPSTRIWITSRPAAAHQIPSKFVQLVTEVRGFGDDQKEEYFRKRISDRKRADKVISHIRRSKSLYIMCHIPVFCWISATVLEQMIDNDDVSQKQENEDVPMTLTGMYTNFMLYQTDLKLQKYPRRYHGSPEKGADHSWEILKLAELAYKNLTREKFIFFEKDLQECGIDVEAASVYSGMFTEVFRKEKTLFRSKAFSFVHLSIQEFLAAVYVFYSYSTKRKNVLGQDVVKKIKWQVKNGLSDLHKLAIKKSLRSQTGHLDLFLRFLLGISLQSNQLLLSTIFPQLVPTGGFEKTIRFIRKEVRKKISPERTINLLHCLNEMNDTSLVEEIDSYVSTRVDHQLSPTECSALVYLLLMSAEELIEFDLRRYLKSDEGLRRMMPLVLASRRALLNECNLTRLSCKVLASAFSSRMSHLKELDLSNNDLQDAGVELLAQGLKSPHCKLQTLKLCGCLLTEKACSFLASALKSDSSQLRELDLSQNQPGEKGVKMIVSILETTDYRLEELKADIGVIRKRTSLQKYKCRLTLNPNTAHRSLSLYDRDTAVVWSLEDTPYPDHPDRFQSWRQVMCREALSGRHYWEVQWGGSVFGINLGVTYEGIGRIGEANVCLAGHNKNSWSLRCSLYTYTAMHNGPQFTFDKAPEDIYFEKIAVYLDWPAGVLSFYTVSVNPSTLIHIYTFHAHFTEPVYPLFTLMHRGVKVVLETSDS